MKILSIGNSFSEDAQRYLHRIAKCDGNELYTVNLCIGGCPLEYHAQNIKSGDKAYTFQENGVITERLMSIEDGISLEKWDVITIQQVSINSFKKETYYPYVFELAEFIREHAPEAKIVFQQTWAYEDGCDRLEEVMGDRSSAKMYRGLKEAYELAASEIRADGIIPSGDLFEIMRKRNVGKLYRDTFHASLGLGRYAIALLWYHMLTGADVSENSFCDFDEAVREEEIAAVKECVMEFTPLFD